MDVYSSFPHYLHLLASVFKMLKSSVASTIDRIIAYFSNKHEDANVNKLVQLLLQNSENDDQSSFDILAIGGMVGSGKTTLAKNIYNHNSIKKRFSSRVWLVLSQFSDHSSVFLEILSQITSNQEKKGSLAFPSFVESVKTVLRGKRCMIVLDDVWGSDSDFLTAILPDLISAGFSKIVIASQDYVKSDSDSSLRWVRYELRCLSEEDSRKLFEKLVCNNGIKLNHVHRELVINTLKKCEGLLLAIIALVELLKSKETKLSQFKSSEEEGTCVFYNFMKEELEKSYEKLPEYLKPCFLYLGVLFPKGSTISVGKLIRMSMAEEFFDEHRHDEEATMEEVAKSWFQKLVGSNMVQVVSRNYIGEVKTVGVHNIMRDLCIVKARELGFLRVVSPNSKATSTSSRHATNDIRQLKFPTQILQFMSLVLSEQVSTTAEVGHSQGNHQVTFDVPPTRQNFELLRVLRIVEIKTYDGTLPTCIGNLTQLRYLEIRSTNIKELPKSIRKLKNLLTLDYRDVFTSSELEVPNVLSELTNLRHLFLPTELNKLTGGLKLHSLKNLQTLWGIGANNWSGKEMKKLKTSSLKKLHVGGISSPIQLEQMLDCPVIKTNDNLCVLGLDWYGFELAILDTLRLKETLQMLSLSGKTTDVLNPILFPSTIQNLQLCYTRLKNPQSMSALGSLPCLKYLKLSKLSFIGSEWICDKESFPILEELYLSNLQSLEQWNMVEGTMPLLRKLSIVSCKKLCRMPKALKFISTVERLEIHGMPASFCSKLLRVKGCKEDGIGRDFHIIQHIPDIQIRNAA